jgi:arylsulfatase A-like enzyme
MRAPLLFAFLSLLVSCASPPRTQSQPHIVLMLADDLGWGDVGFHGSKIGTPNIDSLADRGVRLEQFYVQPVCTPTRGALLTGRYPLRLGLQCGVVRPWAKHGLPLNERTLASALRDAGYATALCGKWHLGHAARSFLPTQRGFDRQYGHYNGALDYFTHIRDGGFDWHENDQVNRDEGYATDLIAKAAVEIIEEHDKARPLFLYVPFNAPHTPLQAPKELIAKYAHIKDRRRRIYAAMVASMDAAVGRITAALRKNGFGDEETLVFFCSDNGGIRQFGSNGDLRAGKGRLYEGGVRVPAVISWPGRLSAGKLVHEPLHIVDLYPTLLRLAGASLEQELPLDGRDAWPVIADGAKSPHELIVHNVTPWSGAIRVGDWKFVHNGGLRANAVKGPERETLELFNIAEDPFEKNNQRSQKPAIFARMRNQLEAIRAAAVKPNLLPNRSPAGFKVPAVWGER